MAGRWAGLAVGALCTSVWLGSDVLNGAIYRYPLIPIWNAIMLFVFFAVVVWLLTAFQRSHCHLERMVQQRTAALRTEIEERKRLEHAKLQAERLDELPGGGMLYNLIRSRKLRSIKIGDRRLVSVTAIRAFVAELEDEVA